MGLGGFWNKDDTNKILDWYGTTVKKATSERDQYGDGIAPTYAATVGIAGSTCFDSEDCGSGFACIGGQCALVDPNRPDATGGGSTAGCGGTGGSGGAPGGGGGPCEAGTGGGGGAGGSGCTKTGAGDCGSSGVGGGGGGGGGADDCCGDTRCCRAGGCSCGPCPPPNNCSQYCAAEKSSTGDSGAGCSDDQECDECSECKQGEPDDDDQADFKCRPRNGGPCNCPNGFECIDCESCNENGLCQKDDSRCLECCTCGGPCPCGKFAQVETCVPYSSGTVLWEDTCMAKCRALIPEACDEICPPPDGGPEPCDCNCHDDCGDCELCGADGRCYPDPSCPNCEGLSIVSYELTSDRGGTFSVGSTSGIRTEVQPTPFPHPCHVIGSQTLFYGTNCLGKESLQAAICGGVTGSRVVNITCCGG